MQQQTSISEAGAMLLAAAAAAHSTILVLVMLWVGDMCATCLSCPGLAYRVWALPWWLTPLWSTRLWVSVMGQGHMAAGMHSACTSESSLLAVQPLHYIVYMTHAAL